MSKSYSSLAPSLQLRSRSNSAVSTLPKAVEELSFEVILNNKKSALQEALPEVYKNLNNSDPAIALLEVSSYSEGILRNRINNGLLSIMLDHAEGSDLDNLGKLYGVERKLIQEDDNTTNPPTPAIYENDIDYRGRIMEAPKGFSVAGPKSSYIYYGKLADNKVKDISALCESPMNIEIRVLSYDGNGEATSELINKVYEKLNSEEIRPMGDKVIVTSSEIVEFNINVEIVFKISNVVDKTSILETIKTNLHNYANGEHRIAGLISQAGIYSCSYLDCVEDVIINSPTANIKCSEKQAPFCLEIIVKERVSDTKEINIE